MADISTTLAQLPLLRGLDEDALAAIAAAGVPIRLNSGDFLVRQGDLGDTLYLLLTGALLARVGSSAGDAASLTVATIMPGEVVGELALLASVPRSADVVATEESTLLMFDRVHALGLLGAHPAIARRVMGQIAARLAHAASISRPGRQPVLEGVSVWQLKAGNEAALRHALTSLPAERETLDQAGMRSVQIFQRGRTIVTVWTAEGAPDPTFAAESATAPIQSLFEEPDEEHGPCVLIHSWQAPGTPRP
jgi:CRP-like cAMP-binding protein